MREEYIYTPFPLGPSTRKVTRANVFTASVHSSGGPFSAQQARSRPIPSLRARTWIQMMPQIHLLRQVVPIPDAGRLHPRSAALHVAVAEWPTVPMENPWPRRLPASARARAAPRRGAAPNAPSRGSRGHDAEVDGAMANVSAACFSEAGFVPEGSVTRDACSAG